MSQRVTLEAIARKSNVSLATVSLALRNKPGINNATRQRVIEVARQLGYQRRPGADVVVPALQQIGLLIKARQDEVPHTNHFYGPVIAGIEAACRRQHINLLYATVPVDDENHPTDVPRMLLERDMDGVLLVGAFVDATITRLMQQRTVPVVLVDGYADDNLYDSVVTDNFRGAYEAVSHLIAAGHRRIGLVGTMPNAYPSLHERRRGYLQALQDHGISAPYFADSHVPLNDIAAATADLLRRSPDVTALFCCNDISAITAMHAARTLGRTIPDDLSIVGFDNIDLAEHVMPGLTTLDVDKMQMGRLAVQLLLLRAESRSTCGMTMTLRPTLIERGSVCPPIDQPAHEAVLADADVRL